MPSVKVRIEKGVETAGDGQERQEQAQQEQKQAVASPTAMLFYHQAISLGKQIVGYATSNVANFTGNNLLQDQVQQRMEFISDITTLATGTLSKGWAGLAVASVGLVTKKVFEQISIYNEERREQYAYDYLNKRTGNSTKNGSRGTEN